MSPPSMPTARSAPPPAIANPTTTRRRMRRGPGSATGSAGAAAVSCTDEAYRRPVKLPIRAAGVLRLAGVDREGEGAAVIAQPEDERRRARAGDGERDDRPRQI